MGEVVHLGDATYFPELIEVNGIKSYKYQLITSIHDYQIIDFVFSEDIIQHKNFFQILDELEMFVKMKNKTKCIQCIESYDEFHYTELKEHYDGLIDTLIDLEKRNLNSIWLKIIGNYLKTGTLRNIDCICGNPPWVRWSNLPDTYKLLIKNNCRVDGIFSGDTNVGGVDLNIAALIAFITIRERLNKNGALGFIMPDAILFNKSFEGFRKMQISDNEKYYLNKVIRWNNKSEKPFDPVTLDFAEYFFSYNKPNKIEVYDRKTSEDKVAYQNPKSFNNHYIISNEKDFEKINGILGKNNYKFHSGVGLVKGGFYLLKFKQTIDDKHSEFYIYQSNGGKKLKPSEKTIVIENEIVYPYIKTDIVNDNIITETDCFCIYPYPYGSKEPYSKKELREKFPKFYNYFISKEVQDAIDSASDYNKRVQKTEFDVGIFRVGEYSYSNWFVITRDNTKSVFAIVNKVKTPWGEDKLPIFDGHINFLSRNEDNSPITEEQANKLFNIFIQEGVKLYIKNSSDARSISSRLYNDIKVN